MTQTLTSPPGDASESFRISVADQQLVYHPLTIRNARPSGEDLLRAAGRLPPEQFILLQVLPDGMLEELRLDERTDLRARGIERFIAVRSDRSYRLEINEQRQEWPAALINGRTLKSLAGFAPEAVDLFQPRAGGGEQEIADGDIVDLSTESLERFITRPRAREVQIFVNNKPVIMTAGRHTGLQIKEAAIAAGIKIKLDFLLSLERPGGTADVIGDADPIKLHKGQHFTAVADDDNS